MAAPNVAKADNINDSSGSPTSPDSDTRYHGRVFSQDNDDSSVLDSSLSGSTPALHHSPVYDSTDDVDSDTDRSPRKGGGATLRKHNARRFRRDQYPAYANKGSPTISSSPSSAANAVAGLAGGHNHLLGLFIPPSMSNNSVDVHSSTSPTSAGGSPSQSPTTATFPQHPFSLKVTEAPKKLDDDNSKQQQQTQEQPDSPPPVRKPSLGESVKRELERSTSFNEDDDPEINRSAFLLATLPRGRCVSPPEPQKQQQENSVDTLNSVESVPYRPTVPQSMSLSCNSSPNIKMGNSPLGNIQQGLTVEIPGHRHESASPDTAFTISGSTLASSTPSSALSDSVRRSSNAAAAKKGVGGAMFNTMRRFKGVLKNISSPNLTRSPDGVVSETSSMEDITATSESRPRSRAGSGISNLVPALFELHFEVVEMVVHLMHGEKNTRRIGFELPLNQSGRFQLCCDAIRRILEVEKYEDVDPTQYRLFHFDRKYPGIRVAVPLDSFIDDMLRANVEWRLLRQMPTECISVVTPDSPDEKLIAYDQKTTVSETVANLMAQMAVGDPKEKYRLFCNSSICYWLDEHRHLYDYDFRPSDRIELRILTVQLYIRISIPDLVNKFVIKVPPYFTGSEIISLISYNLKTRNLTLPHRPAFYGLWIQDSSQWMNNVKKLIDYGLHGESPDDAGQPSEKTAVIDKGMEYRLHRQQINIQAHYGRYEYDARNIRILVQESTTVGDVLEGLNVDNPYALSDKYGLYTRAGELLPPSASVWKTLTEAASMDEFIYRMLNGSIRLRLGTEPDSEAVSVEVNFARPMSGQISLLCRRLGVKDTHFSSFELNGEEVDLDKTPSELNMSKTDLLLMHLDMASYQLERDQQIELSSSRIFGGGERVFKGDGADYNIWEDAEDVPACIQYESSTLPQDAKGSTRVAAANLNKLVQKLTIACAADFAEYTSFVQTFLLTYHSFTDPETLFKKIKERYCIPRWAADSFANYQKERVTVQSRVCNVLKTWTKSYPTSFLDGERGQQLVDDVLQFTEEIMAEDRQHSVAKQIRKTLLKLHECTAVATVSNNLLPAPLPKLPKKISDKPSLFNYDPEEIARQLCLSEHAVYRRIRPTELLGQAWAKKDGQTRAPNVWIMTQRFNNVASWTARSILEQRNLKYRTMRMEWFVDVAWHLSELRNFSVLMAVIAGLNNAAVQRLKFTRNDLTVRAKKRWAEIDRVMSMENSFKNYREGLRSTSADHPTQSKIPYLGVHLSDLVYVEDGNPDQIGALINFAKRRLVYDVITAILEPQDHAYNFTSLAEIQRFLIFPPSSPNLETELYKVSLELEPRGWDGKTSPQKASPPAHH
ncbi:hypothetical protein RI367_003767 [Sorochytrium milnesiophthora]